MCVQASLVVNGRKYEASETVRRYRTLGNATLNVRWITNTPVRPRDMFVSETG